MNPHVRLLVGRLVKRRRSVIISQKGRINLRFHAPAGAIVAAKHRGNRKIPTQCENEFNNHEDYIASILVNEFFRLWQRQKYKLRCV